MDLDGIDVDFLTEDEILNIYNDVLEKDEQIAGGYTCYYIYAYYCFCCDNYGGWANCYTTSCK